MVYLLIITVLYIGLLLFDRTVSELGGKKIRPFFIGGLVLLYAVLLSSRPELKSSYKLFTFLFALSFSYSLHKLVFFVIKKEWTKKDFWAFGNKTESSPDETKNFRKHTFRFKIENKANLSEKIEQTEQLFLVYPWCALHQKAGITFTQEGELLIEAVLLKDEKRAELETKLAEIFA